MLIAKIRDLLEYRLACFRSSGSIGEPRIRETLMRQYKNDVYDQSELRRETGNGSSRVGESCNRPEDFFPGFKGKPKGPFSENHGRRGWPSRHDYVAG